MFTKFELLSEITETTGITGIPKSLLSKIFNNLSYCAYQLINKILLLPWQSAGHQWRLFQLCEDTVEFNNKKTVADDQIKINFQM